MNLRVKIWLAFLGVIGSIVGLGYLGLWNLSAAQDAETDLEQINNQRIFLQRATSQLDTVLALARRLRFEPDEGSREQFETHFAYVLHSLNDLKNSSLSVSSREKVLQLRERIAAFGNLARTGAPTAKLENHGLQIQRVGNALDDHFHKRFTVASRASSHRLQWAYIWFFAAVGVALALSVTFGVFLYRSILSPLAGLRQAADQIRWGNLNPELATHGNDEMAAVSRAFADMSRALMDQFQEKQELLEELHQINRRLESEKRDFERLVEIGTAASSSRQLIQVLKILTSRAAEMIPCLRCSLFFFEEEETDDWQVLSSTLHERGAPIKVASRDYPEVRAAAGRLAIVQIDDVTTDPLMDGVAEKTARVGIGSVLVVPMLHQGRLQGLLSLPRGRDLATFTPWERRLAETIASIGAICMENARLDNHAQGMPPLAPTPPVAMT